MNKHTVFVAGKRFVLLSDDKESYVQKLAGEVSSAIMKIAEANPTLDRRSSAILCALDYADDKYKEIERNHSLSDNAQPLIAQADKQAKKIRELKEQISQRDKLISDYEKKLSALTESDSEQKGKIKKLGDTLDIRDAEVKKLKENVKSLENLLDDITHPLDGPGMVKPVNAKKPQKVDIVEDDDILEDQLFSLFDDE